LKKKIYSRPVSVTLSDDMFNQIYVIVEREEISMSEYIREAIEEKLEVERLNECKPNNNVRENL
jgi:Arc/MetJ-type ribon-helix-helix transcriptional regulator